jgi:putative MATE family efflux protein
MQESKNAINAKYKEMTESRVEPLVFRLAVPTMVSMMISSIYNMADTYFVGKINTSSTAAVGVVFALMAMIQAVGFCFGHGSGNFISRRLGARDYESANKMASIGFFSSIIGGLVITITGFVFMRPLARILGATDTIMPYAIDYMKFILIGAPYMAAALTLNNQLRFQGNAFYAMLGITSGGILNIVLDPIFIFVLEMGTGGAALATIISQFVSVCILFYWVRMKGIPIRLKYFRPSMWYYKEIIRGGSPSLARQGCGSFATLCLNNVAGIYGDAAIAAMSIVTKIAMAAGSAMIGFGQGFQPVCGFNYGAKRYDRVKLAFWFCVKFTFCILFALSALGWLFAPDIVEEFRRDPAVITIGTSALRWMCISFPLTGFIVLNNMMAQTIGKAVRANILAMSRQFLFLLPALLMLPRILGLNGLECSQAVSDVCAFLLSIPLCWSILNEMKK